jgi:hypothetical protein
MTTSSRLRMPSRFWWPARWATVIGLEGEKEALRQFLPAILECYFPAIAAAVDWEHPPEWFNKELSQILGQTGRRNRSVPQFLPPLYSGGTEGGEVTAA